LSDIVYHLSLPPGTLIEDYRIISVLGQGSFGITYLAEDINLGTQVAIKEYLPGEWAFRDSTHTVRPKSTSVGESFERGQEAFLKEARLLARVVHPNIVKVRRFFRAHGTAYIAMDFIKGKSLGDTLGADYPSGGYPSAILTRLLISVLGGLGALHEAGIIHRDIKPGNIVIEPGGNPILVDFGAARNFDHSAQGMTVIVTPGYAPIEQYSDEREQGPFTDIYALGALAYRAITGQAPDAPYKRLGSTTSLSASVAGAGRYPVNLLSAIDWALAVQPQDRPQTAAALLARLRDAPSSVRQVDEPTQILDEPTRIIETMHRREPKNSAGVAKTPTLPGKLASVAAPARRNLRTLIAASVAVLVLAGLAAAYLSTPSKPVDANAVARQEEERRAAQQAAEAEATREEAARQAAAAAETERQAAAAAQAKAEQEAAEKARQEAEHEAAAKAEAEREAAAKAEAERQALAAAAKQEAEREAAAKAEADRQAAAAAAAKRASANQVVKTSPTPRVVDTRCTTILQSAQMGAISDEDKAYLRDNCH
jgi:serine/threonine protein kinase